MEYRWLKIIFGISALIMVVAHANQQQSDYHFLKTATLKQVKDALA